ncbi:MAG: YigZ family protein [Lachnospiraceae bacterium]|nr:YigZ family protein [Lachnospiraceae bacterium]
MHEAYKAVYEGKTGELVEKKSRFIATVFSIESEEDALEKVAAMKKTYWDARHNCYAYVVGDNNEIQRFSDDGEPSQTAGKPMLDVLLAQKIHNVLVVVTRYFGGVLLGTGGLVRAYSKATKLGLDNSILLDKVYGTRMTVKIDYTVAQKIKYIISQLDIYSIDTKYTDVVEEEVVVVDKLLEEFNQKINEATNGNAKIDIIGSGYFGICENKVID